MRAAVVDRYGPSGIARVREKTNPQVVKYLEAENAYTEVVTADLKPFVIYEKK